MSESFRISVTLKNPLNPTISPNQRKCCEKIKSVTAVAGKSLCGLGALGSLLFVTAPAAIPALAAMTAAVPTFACVYYGSTESHQLTHPCTTASVNGLFAAFLIGGFVGGLTTLHTWSYVVNCVYSPETATLAAFIGTGTIAVGGLLWKCSRLL